jgi:hypothetical protein
MSRPIAEIGSSDLSEQTCWGAPGKTFPPIATVRWRINGRVALSIPLDRTHDVALFAGKAEEYPWVRSAIRGFALPSVDSPCHPWIRLAIRGFALPSVGPFSAADQARGIGRCETGTLDAPWRTDGRGE